jgi:nitroreductase
MAVATGADAPSDADAVAFYRRTLRLLDREGLRHLVGGALALAHYAGIEHATQSIDLFVIRDDFDRIEAVLRAKDCRVELTFPHWLGRISGGRHFVNLVFGSANGIADVDEEWFTHATRGEALGEPVWICPVEETIWSKAFVMERERYDGADIAHLIHARGTTLDWRRLMRRFERDWRVLLSCVVMYGYIYPAERDVIPAWLLDELLVRARDDMRTAPPRERVCGGTLVSREQYLVDVTKWGFADARLPPRGRLTPDDIRIWTDAIGRE